MANTVYEQKLNAADLLLNNSTGAAIATQEATVIGGQFVKANEAVANGADGSFASLGGCLVQASDAAGDLKAGEKTFGSANAAVYFDPTSKQFSDTKTSGYFLVGHLLAPLASGVIKFYGLRFVTAEA